VGLRFAPNPRTVTSAAEAPTTEAPATEAPATEAPATEAPATEAPTNETPTNEARITMAPFVVRYRTTNGAPIPRPSLLKDAPPQASPT
jgi:hypothetical protein